MAEDYTVSDGDCLSSIAFEKGFSWEKLWNHPQNSALRRQRKDPNILKAGDVVHIPDLSPKEVSRPTEQRHQFKLKGVPAKLRVRLVDHELRPRTNLPYHLVIDGRIISGRVGGNGLIEEVIPPDARRAVLKFEADGLPQEYELQLGHLDPVDDDAGVHQRLVNLGLELESSELAPQERKRAALASFQQTAGLSVTGELDDATRRKLNETHGD